MKTELDGWCSCGSQREADRATKLSCFPVKGRSLPALTYIIACITSVWSCFSKDRFVFFGLGVRNLLDECRGVCTGDAEKWTRKQNKTLKSEKHCRTKYTLYYVLDFGTKGQSHPVNLQRENMANLKKKTLNWEPTFNGPKVCSQCPSQERSSADIIKNMMLFCFTWTLPTCQSEKNPKTSWLWRTKNRPTKILWKVHIQVFLAIQTSQSSKVTYPHILMLFLSRKNLSLIWSHHEAK